MKHVYLAYLIYLTVSLAINQNIDLQSSKTASWSMGLGIYHTLKEARKIGYFHDQSWHCNNRATIITSNIISLISVECHSFKETPSQQLSTTAISQFIIGHFGIKWFVLDNMRPIHHVTITVRMTSSKLNRSSKRKNHICGSHNSKVNSSLLVPGGILRMACWANDVTGFAGSHPQRRYRVIICLSLVSSSFHASS